MERTIILLTGIPGAGKSTIAEALSTTFAQSAHVPVDFFRKLIQAGYASPHQWNDEVERQYRLARKNAARTSPFWCLSEKVAEMLLSCRK